MGLLPALLRTRLYRTGYVLPDHPDTAAAAGRQELDGGGDDHAGGIAVIVLSASNPILATVARQHRNSLLGFQVREQPGALRAGGGLLLCSRPTECRLRAF